MRKKREKEERSVKLTSMRRNYGRRKRRSKDEEAEESGRGIKRDGKRRERDLGWEG